MSAKLMQAMIPNTLADVNVTGRVTRDSEGAKFTPSGAKVANVSMAVSRRYNQDGEWKEVTAFYTVAVWGDAADRAGQCKKGDIVTASFSMADVEARTYNKQDGAVAGALQVNRAQVSRVAWIPVAGSGGNVAAGNIVPEAVVPAESDFPF
jgi:single-stranded DNA-binding protein